MELSDLNKVEFLKELTDEKIIRLEKYMNFTLEENKKFNSKFCKCSACCNSDF